MTTTQQEKILTKIQRLLALSASANEGEAKAAMGRAQNLMLKHNLSIAEVESFEGAASDTFIESEAWAMPRAPYYQDPIGSILNKYFFVKAFVQRSYNHELKKDVTAMKIFGRQEHVEVAVWVAEYLKATFQRLWAQYRKENEWATRKHLRGYFWGLADGFMDKLKEERSVLERQDANVGNAIVLLDDELQRQAKTRYNLKTRGVSPVDVRASSDGYKAGRDINLNSPVSNGGGVAQLSGS